MFATLSDRLSATFKNIRGKGRLSEADIDALCQQPPHARGPGGDSTIATRAVTDLRAGVPQELGLAVAKVHGVRQDRPVWRSCGAACTVRKKICLRCCR